MTAMKHLLQLYASFRTVVLAPVPKTKCTKVQYPEFGKVDLDEIRRHLEILSKRKSDQTQELGVRISPSTVIGESAGK